ncbi:hypothetical protein K3495_g12979, partial [Podosphaera aphanis]
MASKPFLIDVMLNSNNYAKAFIDSGCLCYSAFSATLVSELNLPRISIPPRTLKLAENNTSSNSIAYITWAYIDIDGHKEKIFGYVINKLAFPLILGEPWMRHNNVVYMAGARSLRIETGISSFLVQESGWMDRKKGISTNLLSASAFIAQVERNREDYRHAARNAPKNKIIPPRQINSILVGAISMRDIDKALSKLEKKDPAINKENVRNKLPEELVDLNSIFDDDDDGVVLPPHRKGRDHALELKKDDQGRDLDVPWGPLYGMSRDELLVLQKTLTDLLGKGWIRASNSPGGAPVLFVKKPGGGLRFCVDYRALNVITRQDRYPLPLFRETLRNIAKARYFTKVDVRAAFHRLRIKGDEWKTAFRTRFGLFEWLVTPFGLAGAPATFQRYINSTLDDFLDQFCSAYMDDVLIYSDSSRNDHLNKVRLVLERLGRAGLKLDIEKCEFAVQEIKYLGFVIIAGQGVKVDPSKVEAIKAWEAPTSVKGVRSFIGFANFYRDFIEDFSNVVAPLISLTQKDQPWKWDDPQKTSFERLKELFITAPILAHWDPDRITLLEADCSGYSMGACLSQIDSKGRLRPVAYFSKKLSPAESNYEIHDKELLSIVRALEEWRSELNGVAKPFTILSDHKNLQCFMTTRKLSERQVRWSLLLSQYRFQLKFRPGKKSQRPDALSRREQDRPLLHDDDRLKNREAQLIKSEWMAPKKKRNREASQTLKNLATVTHATLAARSLINIPAGQDIFEEYDCEGTKLVVTEFDVLNYLRKKGNTSDTKGYLYSFLTSPLP